MSGAHAVPCHEVQTMPTRPRPCPSACGTSLHNTAAQQGTGYTLHHAINSKPPAFHVQYRPSWYRRTAMTGAYVAPGHKLQITPVWSSWVTPRGVERGIRCTTPSTPHIPPSQHAVYAFRIPPHEGIGNTKMRRPNSPLPPWSRRGALQPGRWLTPGDLGPTLRARPRLVAFPRGRPESGDPSAPRNATGTTALPSRPPIVRLLARHGASNS